MNIKKISITFSIVIVCVLCVLGAYYFGSNKLLAIIEKKPEQTATTETTEKAEETSNNRDKTISDKELLDALHSMANTLIIPQDGQIWGKEKITKEKLLEAKKFLSSSTISSKDDLLAMVNRWSNGDFSTAIEDHNKVWKLLDGNIGKAISINEEAVKETLATLMED